MANTAPFDTLAYAKKLEARGVEVKQDEAHAKVLAEVLETSFLTKKDSDVTLTNLSHEISVLRSEIHAEIATVKSDLVKWVFGISFAQAALIISILKFFH